MHLIQSATFASGSEQLRARLIRFYEAYQPEKLEGEDGGPHIDKLMSKVGGGEEGNEKKVEQLFGMLVKKYGPEPEEQPEEEEEAEEENENGQDEHDAEAMLRERLTRFYSFHQPEKLDDPTLLDKFVSKIGDASNEKKVEHLFGMLVKKYGP